MGYAKSIGMIGNPSYRRVMHFPRDLAHIHIAIEQLMTVSHQDARNLGLLTLLGSKMLVQN
jgi:hypothetical protein